MLSTLRYLKTAAAALALLVCVNVRAAQTAFYESADYTSEDWTCQNSTTSNKWTIFADSFKGTTDNGANDSWLFSPAFSLKAGVKYTFTYEIKVNMSSYPVCVCNTYLLPEIKKNATGALMTVAQTTTNGTTAIPVEATFTPETDMTVYFAANDKTVFGSNKGYIFFLKKFKIMADDGKVVPLGVTDLTAAADPDGANSVTLGWTNPAKMSDGSDAEISSLNVYRGEELVKALSEATLTAPGVAASYTDEVPAPGKYEYAVEVIAANGEKSEKATVRTDYVGTFAALVPDYTFDLTDEVCNEHWSLSVNGESNEWAICDGALQVSVSNLKAIDALAVTPAFLLDAAKAYSVSYKQTASNPANEIKLEFATGAAKDALETVFAPSAKVDSKTAVEKSFKFSPSASGDSFFGWHATAEKMTASYYKNTVSITEISIKEIPVLPRIATDVKAVAASDGSLSATVTWTNPTLSETGLSLSDLKADIYRDDVLIEENAAASGIYIDATVPCAGYHSYKVIIKNESGATAEAPEVATTGYIGKPFTIPFASDFAANPFAWASLAQGESATGASWTFSETGATLKEKDNIVHQALLTPPLALEQNQVYELTVNANVSGYSDYKVAIHLLGGYADPEETNMIGETSISNTAKDASVKFAITEEGPYNLAYLILPGTSSYGSERTYTVNSVKVEKAPKIPALPKDLEAKSTAEDNVEITWTMPSETPEGATLDDKVTAKIYRGVDIAEDAVPLHELTDNPGVTLSYTDTEAVQGLNTYTLVFFYGEQQSEAVAVESDYVGAAVEIPFESDFTTEQGRSLWTIIDASSGSYKGTTFEFTDDNTLKVIDGTSASSASSRLDDWVIFPIFTVYSGSTLTVEFEAKANGKSSAYSATPYEAFIGKDKTVEALKAGTKIGSGKLGSETSDYTTYKHDYTTEASRASTLEKKTVGLHFGGGYGYPYVELKSIKVGTDKPTFTGVEDVAGVAPETAIWFDGQIVSSSDEDASITLFDTTGRAVASGRGSVGMDGLASGVYIVAVSASGKTDTLKIAK